MGGITACVSHRPSYERYGLVPAIVGAYHTSVVYIYFNSKSAELENALDTEAYHTTGKGGYILNRVPQYSGLCIC